MNVFEVGRGSEMITLIFTPESADAFITNLTYCHNREKGAFYVSLMGEYQ